ncbi:hypothetical protein LT493_19665 [Streptomyces tricolor]|nr:hypothetical protein [Streptomyces tricolor]
MVGGHVEDAFGRLIDTVQRTAGDDRDAVRPACWSCSRSWARRTRGSWARAGHSRVPCSDRVATPPAGRALPNLAIAAAVTPSKSRPLVWSGFVQGSTALLCPPLRPSVALRDRSVVLRLSRRY